MYQSAILPTGVYVYSSYTHHTDQPKKHLYISDYAFHERFYNYIKFTCIYLSDIHTHSNSAGCLGTLSRYKDPN